MMSDSMQHSAMGTQAERLCEPEENGKVERKERYPVRSLAALMDLRAWIAAMFFTFGVMLTGYGLFFTTASDLQKAGGLNLNLGTGVGMILAGFAFLIWFIARPPEVGEAKIGDPNERVEFMILPIEDGDVSPKETSSQDK